MLAAFSSLVMLAFAVSLDGFGVGMTYGVRQIRIPLPSVIIISVCSGAVLLAAMLAGTLVARWIPPQAASAAGGCLLIGIGVWALAQLYRSGEARQAEENGANRRGRTEAADHSLDIPQAAAHPKVWTLEIRSWGIVIQILKSPSVADMDRSGTISPMEACLLGAALSLDAFGAGIGAAMIGFPILPTAALIAVSGGTFLWLGTRVGLRAADWRWLRQLSLVPGLILIAIGLLKLM